MPARSEKCNVCANECSLKKNQTKCVGPDCDNSAKIHVCATITSGKKIIPICSDSCSKNFCENYKIENQKNFTKCKRTTCSALEFLAEK